MSARLLREYVALVVEKIRSKKGVDSKLGSQFDLQKFKSLENVNIMVQYAQTFLSKLGEGSSRVAFVLSSKHALKIALNKKGLAQNQAELDVFTNPKSKLIVTKIYAADPEFRWVVSDLVKPLSSEGEFEQLTGVNWKEFTYMIRDYVHDDVPVPKDAPNFVKAVVSTALDNDLLTGDIKELEHWGKTADGRCVMLDSGYTREVWASHYSKKPIEPKSAGPEEKTKKPGAETTKQRPTSGDVPTRQLPKDKTPLASTELAPEPDEEKTKR